MKLTIIEELRKAKPKKRAQIVTAMHAKNVAYFKSRHPALGEALGLMGTGSFEIRINETFLDILERPSGAYCHPPGKLLDYIETVASWHHSGWIDKLEVLHRYPGEHEHGQLVRIMTEGVFKALPLVSERLQSGVIKLPQTKGGRRFSGSTVFLGALTGLHIVHYLNTTVVRDIVIIEPDVKKFALSCWFVDYQAIEKKFARLVLHVGGEMPENPLHYLMGASPVTAGVWMRMLPIYPSEAFTEIINRVNLRWRAIHEINVPFDREVRNLVYGARNVKDGRPILSRRPKLSPESRVAVVASGPSLEKDMEWLRANQDRLIIFAALSAVRALKGNGIRPDFQCTLDTELDDELFRQLDLDADVPLVAYYKIDPAVLSKFRTVLLVPESQKANAVEFREPISHTHPTTGNLAASVALFMRPSELYLLGLDLGFRKAARSHVAGGWHDDNEGVGHELETDMREQVPSPSNFPEGQGEIFTHAYYHSSRATVEAAIAATEGSVQVFNLSDGVRVEGAAAKRSREVDLPAYGAKADDLAAVASAFSGEQEGVWSPFPARGEAILRAMRESMLGSFDMKNPDWEEFAVALDTAWVKFVVDSTRVNPADIRLEAYARIAVDVLSAWYRIMVFSKTPAEFRAGFSAGVVLLGEIFDKLRWPAELDFEIAGNSHSPPDPVHSDTERETAIVVKS